MPVSFRKCAALVSVCFKHVAQRDAVRIVRTWWISVKNWNRCLVARFWQDRFEEWLYLRALIGERWAARRLGEGEQNVTVFWGSFWATSEKIKGLNFRKNKCSSPLAFEDELAKCPSRPAEIPAPAMVCIFHLLCSHPEHSLSHVLPVLPLTSSPTAFHWHHAGVLHTDLCHNAKWRNGMKFQPKISLSERVETCRNYPIQAK